MRQRHLRAARARADHREVGLRARLTTRLVEQVVSDLAGEPRSVSAVAARAGLSWRAVMGLVSATVAACHDVDAVAVRRLGIDERRFRTVRFVRLADGPTVRVEPWSVVFTDLDTGAVLDVVDGCRGRAVRWWLRARPVSWRARLRVAAMDISSEFRAAVRRGP